MSKRFENLIARVAAEGGSRSRLDLMSAAEWEDRTGYRGQGLTLAQLKDRIMAEQERQKAVQARRGAARPTPDPEPGRILELAERKLVNIEETAAAFAACRPLFEAQQQGRDASVRIGQAIVAAVEVGRWNYDRYSKGWHRQHGGVWEVQGRRVELLRANRVGALEVVRKVWIDGFRGHWLIRAIAELYDLPKVRVPRALKAVQMGDFFEVEQVRSLGGVRIYRRTLAGETVDYCAVMEGTTYHAAGARAALVGLRHKCKQARGAAARVASAEAEMLTVEHGRRLGFCEAGMNSFCVANGVDFHGAYSRGDLRQRIALRKRHNQEHWGRELRQIGLL